MDTVRGPVGRRRERTGTMEAEEGGKVSRKMRLKR